MQGWFLLAIFWVIVACLISWAFGIIVSDRKRRRRD